MVGGQSEVVGGRSVRWSGCSHIQCFIASLKKVIEVMLSGFKQLPIIEEDFITTARIIG